MCEKLAQDNSVLSKLHHYVWQNTYISLYFSLFYSLFTHILYGSSAWKFNSKSNLNRVFMAITPWAVMVLLYEIHFLNIFFLTIIWLPSLNWSHFLWNDSYKLTKMNCKLLTHLSNNFLSIFSPGHSFMDCSPATQSSNLMIEVDKVICMDLGVYVFYMCVHYIYVYTSTYYLL